MAGADRLLGIGDHERRFAQQHVRVLSQGHQPGAVGGGVGQVGGVDQFLPRSDQDQIGGQGAGRFTPPVRQMDQRRSVARGQPPFQVAQPGTGGQTPGAQPLRADVELLGWLQGEG